MQHERMAVSLNCLMIVSADFSWLGRQQAFR